MSEIERLSECSLTRTINEIQIRIQMLNENESF